MNRRRTSAVTTLAVTAALVLAIVAAGCGSGGGPSTVNTADLHQDGAFWLSLDAPLRRELAGICLDKQIKTAPADLVLSLQKTDVDDYVALVTREYEEQGDASASDIEEACEEAKVEVAREELDQIMPALRREAAKARGG